MKTAASAHLVHTIRNVRFVSNDDPGYQAHCRRARNERRALQSGTTAAAVVDLLSENGAEAVVSALRYSDVTVELGALDTNREAEAREQAAPPRRLSRSQIGNMVERAARRLLGHAVKLEPGRVVAWRERISNNTYETRYQEVDALWWSEQDTVVLYEVKFTSLERMQQQVGRRQLERARRAALAHPQVNAVRGRLVYIGDAEDRLLTVGTRLCADDADPDFGIVWISPEEIEWAARDLGLNLPADWRTVDTGPAQTAYAILA